MLVYAAAASSFSSSSAAAYRAVLVHEEDIDGAVELARGEAVRAHGKLSHTIA
jgi:hypothetical protein